ncbi:hypothetical protein EGW08_015393 [Elysia chlorotica]|uniref:Fibronectin type-III domain-containing protein n=1 Tax=Elysia chlorotica TaxID=188477 RepID=A0A3S1B5W2_ELYCH|nr:hypothetical protein EGW08_015393 [Elysia chlorotica]
MCPRYWFLHGPTGTCFRVFTDRKGFYGAKDACSTHLGGPDRTFPGWLAGIHDRETDIFVRSLLAHGQQAFIGLFSRNREFVWDDGTEYISSYQNWLRGEPYYDFATITRTTWNTSHAATQRDYVCQMRAMFQKPTLGCEPMKIGDAFSPMVCQVSVQQSFGSFDEIVIENSQHGRLLGCRSDMKCDKSNDFMTATISIARTTISTTVTVDRVVARSDDGIRWGCVYHFLKTPNNFLTTSCKTQVYSSPTGLKCKHTISDNLNISCEAEGVYPEADSHLEHYINGILMAKWLWSNAENTQYQDSNNHVFYRSVFQKSTTGELNEGKHTLKVVVYPKAQFSSSRKKKDASESYSFDFIILAPTTPPTFSTENDLDIKGGKLIVKDGDDVRLICAVIGGYPPVYYTNIICDEGVGEPRERETWYSRNQKAEAKFIAHRQMNQKSCRCSAKHVSGQYKETSSIQLDIQYAVKTSVFTLNGMIDDEIELRAGEKANFKCAATGNPKPNLEIFHLYNKGESSKSLGNISNSEELPINVEVAEDMSGIYTCSAGNNLNTEVQTLRIHLMVIGPPRPCSLREFEHQFSAKEGHEVQLEMCVYAYPPISSLKLAKGALLREENYEIKFKYTYADEAMAVVSVKIQASKVQLGEFQIYTNQDEVGRSKLTFNLVPYQKPSCPETLEPVQVGTRFSVLSWQPASDRGMVQTFSVLTVDAENTVIDRQHIRDDGKTVMTHNVTNLEPNSIYRFLLEVENEQGITECQNLTLKIITKVDPVSDSSSELIKVGTIVGVVIVIVILLIVIVVACVLIGKRKRKIQNEDTHMYSEIKKTSDKQGGVNKRDEKHMNSTAQSHTFDQQSDATEHNNTYTNHVAMRINATDTHKEFLDSSEKEQSKPVKPQPSPRKSRADGDISTSCLIIDAKQVNNGQTKEAINTKEKSMKVRPNEHKAKKEDAGGSEEVPDNSVILKQANKELVYIEVDIVPKKEGKPNRQPEITDDSVTYASVNFNASMYNETADMEDDVKQTVL